MKQNVSKKKGVTLAEICVVLAIISICSVMVVSFSLMVNRRSAAAQARLAAMEDMTSLEIVVESWVERLTVAGATFTGEPEMLSATLQGVSYTCTFDGERLVGTLPDGTELTYLPETVTAISFTAAQKSADSIFFCTVTYEINGEASPYTFCVNPYVGETVGTEGV